MIRIVHVAAAVTAFLTIFLFWTSTAASELSGDPAAIAAVKRAILWGLLLLVPSMAVVGGSGFRLGRGRRDPLTARKRLRMPFIALNGLLILVPAAFFLEARAAVGVFDTAFIAVQALELIAGATNLTLIGLNMRDGLRLAARRAALEVSR